MNPREMTMADVVAQPVDFDRITQLEPSLERAVQALWDIRDACGREGALMTPSEVSQLAVERIAALEAERAALVMAMGATRDECSHWAGEYAACRERETALAAENERLLDSALLAMAWMKRSDALQALIPVPVLIDNPIPYPPKVDLAAHDAEVARVARIEELKRWCHWGEAIRARIAALKAEGGKG